MGTDQSARPPSHPPGRGRLRASRADREQVVEVLKAAFVADRLTKDEFDARIGQTLASRTYDDLAALTADLPAEPDPVAPAGPAAPAGPPRPGHEPRPGNATVRRGTRVIAVTTAITAGAWAAALLTPDGNQVLGMLLWALTFLWFGIVLMVSSVMIEAQVNQDPPGELPPAPGRASQPPARRLPGVQT